MATYNGERFLEEQLESLARQTLLPCELQVGDDGSTDATLDILADFARRSPFPVVVHRNTGSAGYGENFLQTARRCSGEWIAFSDQDDIWNERKLRTVAEAAAHAGPELQLMVHDALVVDQQRTPIGRLYGTTNKRLCKQMTLAPGTLWLGFVMTFHRRLVRDIRLNPRARHPEPPNPAMPQVDLHSHDFWISLLAQLTGSILILPDLLAEYRRHGATITALVDKPDLIGRSTAAAANHAPRYAFLADWHSETADVLAAAAHTAANPSLASRLEAAAAALRRQDEVWRARAQLHSAGSLSSAWCALCRLFAAGAYGGAPWPLPPRSLLKDLLTLVRRPAAH